MQQCLANRATDTREPCKIPCSFCAYVSESCCCSPSPFVHGGGASVPPVPKMMANLSSPSRALFFTPVVRTETLHLDESDSPSSGDSSSETETKSSVPPHLLLLWDFKYFSFSDDDCTHSLIKMDHHSTFGLFSSVGSTLIPLCFFLCVSPLFAAPKGGPHKNHHQHQPRERKKIHLPTFPLFLLFGSVIFHSCWNRSENSHSGSPDLQIRC